MWQVKEQRAYSSSFTFLFEYPEIGSDILHNISVILAGGQWAKAPLPHPPIFFLTETFVLATDRGQITRKVCVWCVWSGGVYIKY